MSTSSSQSEKTKEEKDVDRERKDIATLVPLRTSKYPDQKNMFKHEEKEKAFKKRYGKGVLIAVTYEAPNEEIKSFNEITEYTLRFQSDNNKHYTITEYMIDGETDYVLLCYVRNNRKYENRYSRFIDAEITLADKISEEEDGNT